MFRVDVSSGGARLAARLAAPLVAPVAAAFGALCLLAATPFAVAQMPAQVAAPVTAPPPAAAPAPAPAPQAPAAAAAAAPAAVAAAEEDKPFQPPAGWRPKTVKGEEVYCKKTAVTGSRFGTELCMTLSQLEQHERNNAEMRDRMRQSFRVCSGGSPCTNN